MVFWVLNYLCLCFLGLAAHLCTKPCLLQVETVFLLLQTHSVSESCYWVLVLLLPVVTISDLLPGSVVMLVEQERQSAISPVQTDNRQVDLRRMWVIWTHTLDCLFLHSCPNWYQNTFTFTCITVCNTRLKPELTVRARAIQSYLPLSWALVSSTLYFWTLSQCWLEVDFQYLSHLTCFPDFS